MGRAGVGFGAVAAARCWASLRLARGRVGRAQTGSGHRPAPTLPLTPGRAGDGQAPHACAPGCVADGRGDRQGDGDGGRPRRGGRSEQLRGREGGVGGRGPCCELDELDQHWWTQPPGHESGRCGPCVWAPPGSGGRRERAGTGRCGSPRSAPHGGLVDWLLLLRGASEEGRFARRGRRPATRRGGAPPSAAPLAPSCDLGACAAWPPVSLPGPRRPRLVLRAFASMAGSPRSENGDPAFADGNVAFAVRRGWVAGAPSLGPPLARPHPRTAGTFCGSRRVHVAVGSGHEGTRGRRPWAEVVVFIPGDPGAESCATEDDA